MNFFLNSFKYKCEAITIFSKYFIIFATSIIFAKEFPLSPKLVIIILPRAPGGRIFRKITRSGREIKRDNRIHKTGVSTAFFSLVSVAPEYIRTRGRGSGEESTKISRKHLAYPELKHNEKTRVYTPCLIIMVRSTVRTYSEGYAWARRTSENVRDREGWKGSDGIDWKRGSVWNVYTPGVSLFSDTKHYR